MLSDDDVEFSEGSDESNKPDDVTSASSTEFTQLIFREGDATKILLEQPLSLSEIRTAKQEADIQEARGCLQEIIEKFESTKKLYKNMLQPLRNGYILEINATIKNQTTGLTRQAQPEDIKNQLISLQDEAEEYIDFLSDQASDLIKKSLHERAKNEFKICLDFLIQINRGTSLKFFKINLDYLTANLACDTTLANALLMEKNILAIQAHDSNTTRTNDTKKALAISHYILAQYYLDNYNFEKTELHLNQSETLRKEYSATEIEMDRIDFLRGKLALMQGRKEESLVLLEKSYHFRLRLGEHHFSLIPVLQLLSEAHDDLYQKIRHLDHLLKIQKIADADADADQRKIIYTQLQILDLMAHRVSSEEYETILTDIRSRLNNIGISAENFEIGIIYYFFADALLRNSMNISNDCPIDEELEKKLKITREAQRILFKTTCHIEAEENSAKKKFYLKKTEELKSVCINRISLYEDQDFKSSLVRNSNQTERFEEATESSSSSSNQEIIIPVLDHLPLLKNSGDSLNKEDKNFQDEMQTLSTYSSEVNYEALDPPSEQPLTLQDFNALTQEGFINPWRIRTAQGGINNAFRDGTRLEMTLKLLIDDPKYTNQIPPIEIGEYEGKIYSFDTRRLLIHQQAREGNPEVNIRYRKITGPYLQERIEAIFSPRPWNGWVTAERFGGKNSESKPYINPLVRPQIEDRVLRTFKPYPSDREHADSNGFPVQQQKAKKIFSFFKERSSRGDEDAKKIIEKGSQVFNQQGEAAYYDFFIDQKTNKTNSLSIVEEDDCEEDISPSNDFH